MTGCVEDTDAALTFKCVRDISAATSFGQLQVQDRKIGLVILTEFNCFLDSASDPAHLISVACERVL